MSSQEHASKSPPPVPDSGNFAHTPGPWHFQNGGCELWEVNSEGEGKKWSAVADVSANHAGSRPISADEAEANARLIAAAPELLRHLETVVAAVVAAYIGLANANGNVDADNWTEIVNARAAIAKAKGGAA